MKIWLDDVRLPPDGWTWVKTPWEAIDLLKTNTVDEISLDNDLGLFNYDPTKNEGRHVAAWIEEQAMTGGDLKPLDVWVHTSNKVAHREMALALTNAYKAWDKKIVNRSFIDVYN